MFGLMKPKRCCSIDKTVDSSYTFHRMHYCGTCKAIGSQFDQSSRMLLNFDTVFLSEILSLLNKEETESWERNLKKVNTCFSMPKEELPFSLQYAAATNIVLGELKFDDNLKDNKGVGWKIANRYFSSSFAKAKNKFETWGIDLSSIYSWIERQEIRENELKKFDSLEDCLNYYAEATASITATVFEEGAKRTVAATDLHELGFQFGQLMYILDAFEDYERDVFEEQFNPLRVYFGTTQLLTTAELEKVRGVILALQQKIELSFDGLPIGEEFQSLYKSRLGSNVALRLYKERVVPHTWKERVVLRWQNAKDFANQITCTPTSWVRQLNYYMIVLAVFVSPKTSEYLPQDGKAEVLGWTALIVASLAGLGLYRSAKMNKEKNKEKRKEKKRRKKGAVKRFMNSAKRVLRREQNCFSSCCGVCCEACCEGCCQGCCEGCCEGCCNSLCDSGCEDDKTMMLILLTAVVVVVAIIIILVILFQ